MTPQSSPGEKHGAPPAETPGSPDLASNAADDTAGDTVSAPAADADPDGAGSTPVAQSRPEPESAPDAETTPEKGSPAEAAAESEPVRPPTIDWASSAPATAQDQDADGEPDSDDLQGEFVPVTDDTPAVTGSTQDTLIPLVGSLLGLVAIAALLIVAFVLPASKGGPHNVPFGVAGTEQFKAQVKSLFAQGGTNAFEVKSYSSEASLRQAINNRSVYGGLNLGTQNITMLISSAASVDVANTLNSLGTRLQVEVSDAKAAPEKDPLGAGLRAAGLPLAIVALLPALLLIRVYRNRPLAQLGTAIGAAFGIGAAAAAMLTYWIGATQGANFWLLTVALAAGVLSVSLLLLGLYSVGGRIGLGIGVAVLVFVSVPLAGFASGPEWLPAPWGDIGRYLPAGAGSTLLRNAAFFDGNAAGVPLAVLGAWALAGLLMLGLSEGLTPQEPLGEEPPRPAEDVLAV